ncbi:hypothetical protein [Geofilum rubicundum]|uniref:hypothetical protein n=1 Tax=Geofilum rubicundum TaxID=472113 RepID=UPI0012FC5B7C|nr:hypothetical protein [Geofilum rubicundum]
MKSFHILILILLSGIAICAQTATISNIRATPQRDGSGIVEVQYDLEGQNAYNLSLEVSFDAGDSYEPIPFNHLSGDVTSVSSGANNLIVWDGKQTFPETNSNIAKIKVIATTGNPNHGHQPGRESPTSTATPIAPL